MRSHSNENGYTMLEAIMYISIMMVLGTVLAKYVHSVFQRYKTGRVSQQVVDIKKAVTFFTAADEDYSRLTLDEMVEKRALPYDLLSKRSALGGVIKLGPVSELMATPVINDNYMFYITFGNLPMASCVELLSQGQFYGGGTDIDTILVNGTHAWRYQYSLYNTGATSGLKNVETVSLKANQTSAAIEVTVAKAVQACSKKENNEITWIFS